MLFTSISCILGSLLALYVCILHPWIPRYRNGYSIDIEMDIVVANTMLSYLPSKRPLAYLFLIFLFNEKGKNIGTKEKRPL